MKGLYDKFTVTRTDGQDKKKDDKHYRCDYFVLDLTHDKHAMVAIHAYAKSVIDEDVQLAIDLLVFVNDERIREELEGDKG